MRGPEMTAPLYLALPHSFHQPPTSHSQRAVRHLRLLVAYSMYPRAAMAGDRDHDTALSEANAVASRTSAAFTKIGECNECTQCGTGTEVDDECNRVSDRTCRCHAGFFGITNNGTVMVCTACADGKFSLPGAAECSACSTCGFGTELIAPCNLQAREQHGVVIDDDVAGQGRITPRGGSRS